MSIADVLLLIIRWLHALAAVAWVGGGLFYLFVLRPSLKATSGKATSGFDVGEYPQVGDQFRNLVNTAIAVLIVTGVVLTLSRLTSDYGGIAYVIVLCIKVGLALYMFYLARFFLRHRQLSEPEAEARKFRRFTSLATSATTVLVLGVIVFLLADILASLVEQELRS